MNRHELLKSGFTNGFSIRLSSNFGAAHERAQLPLFSPNTVFYRAHSDKRSAGQTSRFSYCRVHGWPFVLCFRRSKAFQARPLTSRSATQSDGNMTNGKPINPWSLTAPTRGSSNLCNSKLLATINKICASSTPTLKATN